jgi:hypothetical protein
LGLHSTDDETIAFINANYIPNANQTTLNTLAQLYPNDPAVGSPFNTGMRNQITPQWKRLSAFQGDLIFQGPRRLFINNRATKQPIWSFCECVHRMTATTWTLQTSIDSE